MSSRAPNVFDVISGSVVSVDVVYLTVSSIL